MHRAGTYWTQVLLDNDYLAVNRVYLSVRRSEASALCGGSACACIEDVSEVVVRPSRSDAVNKWPAGSPAHPAPGSTASDTTSSTADSNAELASGASGPTTGQSAEAAGGGCAAANTSSVKDSGFVYGAFVLQARGPTIFTPHIVRNAATAASLCAAMRDHAKEDVPKAVRWAEKVMRGMLGVSQMGRRLRILNYLFSPMWKSRWGGCTDEYRAPVELIQPDVARHARPTLSACQPAPPST